ASRVERATLCGDVSWLGRRRLRAVRSTDHSRAPGATPDKCRTPATVSAQRSERCRAPSRSPTVVSNPCYSSELFPRFFDLGIENHWCRTRYPAVLANPPEMHDHENQRDDGYADTVPDVRAQ